MLFNAGQATAVVGELARRGIRLRGVIAEQQIRTLLIDAHVEAPGRLRVETLGRGIAIHRIKLVGLNVAEQTLASVLVGIVGGGQQILALDFTLEEKCGTGSGAEFAIAAGVGQMLEFLIEAILLTRRHQAVGVDIAQIDDAFDNAGADQRTQIRHKVDGNLSLDNPGTDAHQPRARLLRGQ